MFYLFPSYLTLQYYRSTEVTKWFQEAATRLGHRLADTRLVHFSLSEQAGKRVRGYISRRRDGKIFSAKKAKKPKRTSKDFKGGRTSARVV